MASQITDPKDFAQHIDEKMLAEFLQMQKPPIPFEIKEQPKKSKKRVDKDVVEHFIKTIEELSDKKRAQYLFGEMLYVNELSGQMHISKLENQATENGIIFGIDDDYDQCACLDERALWWYIHHKEKVFDKYFERAETENLAGLREMRIKEKYIVEKEKIIDDSKITLFGDSVSKVYENVLRGNRFSTKSFIDEDCVFLRVYLENLPENQLVFDDDKEQQSTITRTISARSLFNILFVYNHKEHTLGTRTTSPKENVPKLADIFCKTYLNCTYADTEEIKYNVENTGSVKKLELTPDPVDTIERCYLKAVEYKKLGDSTKTLRLDIGGKRDFVGTTGMEQMIDEVFRKEDAKDANGGMTESEWTPKKFEIKFIFKKVDETKGRKRQITVSLTKRGVNLKGTIEDQKIRQFLENKGFIS